MFYSIVAPCSCQRTGYLEHLGRGCVAELSPWFSGKVLGSRSQLKNIKKPNLVWSVLVLDDSCSCPQGMLLCPNGSKRMGIWGNCIWFPTLGKPLVSLRGIIWVLLRGAVTYISARCRGCWTYPPAVCLNCKLLEQNHTGQSFPSNRSRSS